MLSATICEKFTDMKIPFYLFGFIPKYLGIITIMYVHFDKNIPSIKLKNRNI